METIEKLTKQLRSYASAYDKLHRDIADDFRLAADELERLQKGLAKIAEMTDVEADFADGFELRAIARTALQGAADV